MRRFNLSLDDYSPKPETNDLCWCDKLIEKYQDIKINLFVPAAFCRLGEKPHYLTENLEWVEQSKKLPKNYRINLHGMYHRRVDGINPNSNNNEFEKLNRNMAKTTIDAMLREFDVVGLKFHRTFRPPGWYISKPAVEELIRRKILIAGDEKYYRLYEKKIPDLRKKWISYNWNIAEECNIVSGDILAYGHTSSWTNNSMNEERFKLIDGVLSSGSFEFKFLEDCKK